MGPKQSQNNQYSEDRLNKNHFEFLHVVGKGGFGKFYSKKNKRPFALKEMSKVKIIDRKSERSIMSERELLAKLKHPFIVNMQYAFQDYDNLYLVMDLLTGGDLRYHISRHKRFSEEQTRFFVACIILGLEYVHGNKVIHRDIKPENLVLDEKGYVRITDFGVAKFFQKDNSSETSGTPGYMAPEVMCAQNHSYFVDFFAVGVMAFEFMYGVRPYLGKSRKEIKDLILAKQVQIKPGDIPDGWSIEAADFINKMLQRKPVNRLGYNGISEIKEHPWLKYYPWRDLFEKKLEAPFAPKNIDNFDKKYCEGPDKIGNETLDRYQNYYKNEALNEIFINYSFENLISVQSKKIDNTSKKPNNNQNSNHHTYISNINNSASQKKRVSSSLSNLSLNKNSLNGLLKNKMKITESLNLNQYNPANNSNNIMNNNNNNNNYNKSSNSYIIAKQTAMKNRTSSQNMSNNYASLAGTSMQSPNHVRNMSSNSNLSLGLNSGAYAPSNLNNNFSSSHKSNLNLNNNINNNLIISQTPQKASSFNSLNLLKSRSKNLSMNSNNLSGSLGNINNLIGAASSSVILNMNQPSATPLRNAEKSGIERLPFIGEQAKMLNPRQFSSNIAVGKKLLNPPLLKNSAVTPLQMKAGAKYTTLSANSTGSSTISMNFLHRRSGSTNTFNNY